MSPLNSFLRARSDRVSSKQETRSVHKVPPGKQETGPVDRHHHEDIGTTHDPNHKLHTNMLQATRSDSLTNAERTPGCGWLPHLARKAGWLARQTAARASRGQTEFQVNWTLGQSTRSPRQTGNRPRRPTSSREHWNYAKPQPEARPKQVPIQPIGTHVNQCRTYCPMRLAAAPCS